MDTLYDAYGMRLESAFALPGMRAPERSLEGLPTLTLALEDPEELARTWSATDAAPEWRGRLGDGRELRIERDRHEQLLFSYGELARFRLRADMQRLDCAPTEDCLDWQRALIGKVISCVSVMRGYEGLHAAAVDSPEGVVAIMAPSGSGKSTLALELLRRGWPLFADDQLTLARGASHSLLAQPGTPHMSLAAGQVSAEEADALGETLAILAGERWLAAHNTTAQARPVRMLCLLERADELPLELNTLAANPLALAPHILGFPGDLERRRSRFGVYGDLMHSATLVRLTAGPEHRPEQLADLIERELAPQPIAGASR
jgi:hypothetical protein